MGTAQTTDTNGETVFVGAGTGLPDGYYVLVETAPLTGYDAAAPSVIRLPLTATDGQSFNYDVHVYPKNISSGGVVVKQLGAGGAKPITNGDTIPFELLARFKNDETGTNQVNNVNDLKNGAVYGGAQIIDTLSTELSYNGDVAVYWMANDGTLSTTALLPGEYGVTAPGTGGGRIVTVTLNNTGIQKAIDNQYSGFGITLTADYIGGASTGASATNIINKMGAIIRKAGSPTTQQPTETTVYAPQLQLTIEKVADTASGAKMLGIEFMLLRTATPTVNYKSGTSLTDSTYTQAQKDDIKDQYVLDKNGVPVVGTTDAAGKVIFSNLPGYLDASGASFWVKETKTNVGYQLKTALIEVTFEKKSTYQGDSTKALWFDGTGNWKGNTTVANAIQIINYKQGKDPSEPIFSLPLTGGAGTVAFTIAGIVVMLGAAILIIRKKKEV